MALRLRRDVQKASYYVWFLGAEEAKGLRGPRVINSVLPYLIDRSRGQEPEPLKVTLQVSHKGIKILQGSSKHFIPHSAITSSVQMDDIVACVLLLYNPATKCPLHVHAYRCDSESTAEALHQQLQTLINRPENQKRFEELETRLGILPPLPTSSNKSATHLNKEPQGQKTQPPFKPPQQRRLETSPKRFNSSLGSDTGNSTRESECSEEHSGGSPISRSPPIVKPLPQQNNELFDSLAAELRAKLNGNGPPILLPPRDYDTVHRSKGNLTAIELRRCRNKLIVGGATPNGNTPQNAAANGKQVSSRGSSGIGSDLAPSPERQDLNSSSDDEHWSNEADNSVIALKPSQIPVERSGPIIPHHPQLNRKSAVQPPEDSYLRDLPAKPYVPKNTGNTKITTINNNTSSNVRTKPTTALPHERDGRTKTPSNASWSREDEIKPIIMRPADYDAKFNRVLQAEQKQDYVRPREHAKLQDTDKYNEINRLLNKKLSVERDSTDLPYKHKPHDIEEDFEDSDPSSDHLPVHVATSSHRRENLTDKQKFMEYSSKKQLQKSYPADEAQRYGGRHRYVDPADLPFDQPTHNKFAAVHRSDRSPERPDHRAEDRERQRERPRDVEVEGQKRREYYSRSNERNPYREPESIPYIQSMEKMMKSAAIRYKSYDGVVEPHHERSLPKDETRMKVGPRKSYQKYESDNIEREFNYPRARAPYATSTGSNVTAKERSKEHPKERPRPIERSSSRHDLVDEKHDSDYKPRRRGSVEDWSDEDINDAPTPPPVSRTRSRSRDQWEHTGSMPPKYEVRERERDPRDYREYPRDIRAREPTGKHVEPRDAREHARVMREPRQDYRYEPRVPERELPREAHHRPREREHSRDYVRRDYSPDSSSRPTEYQRSDYSERSVERQRLPHPDMYHTPTPPTSATNGAAIPSAKGISNLPKGYRHSYAEPAFARPAGRVGLAAVNPY